MAGFGILNLEPEFGTIQTPAGSVQTSQAKLIETDDKGGSQKQLGWIVALPQTPREVTGKFNRGSDNPLLTSNDWITDIYYVPAANQADSMSALQSLGAAAANDPLTEGCTQVGSHTQVTEVTLQGGGSAKKQLPGEYHTLVASGYPDGDKFLATELWISRNFWDVNDPAVKKLVKNGLKASAGAYAAFRKKKADAL